MPNTICFILFHFTSFMLSIKLHNYVHSLETGKRVYRCSKVIPLFKRGKRRDLSNERPISIIPVVAKVFERIIYNQVYAFLEDNNLLTSSQSGFRGFHSTVTALLEATNCWAYNIDGVDPGDIRGNSAGFADFCR